MLAVPVAEISQVAEARRQATALAADAGFPAAEIGRIALTATELATNLVKHGRGGRLLVAAGTRSGHRRLDLLALDRGPGMADITACLRDGYSTSGSPGTGLGAVRRQASLIDIYSRPGSGTAILARFAAPDGRDAGPGDLDIGAVELPIPGERVSGDAWSMVRLNRMCRLLLADGLGHGPLAATAARAAVATFEACPRAAPADLLDSIHRALHDTRGAAVALADIDYPGGTAAFCGIGNIAGLLAGPDGVRRMVSLNGTAGSTIRGIRTFAYPVASDTVVVLHSDGLATSWSFDAYPGLLAADPALIAAVLCRDHARGRDDVTVIVAKRRSV